MGYAESLLKLIPCDIGYGKSGCVILRREAAGPSNSCAARRTFSASVQPAVVSSLPILRSHSLAKIGSVLLEDTGGFNLRKRAKLSTRGGGGGLLLLLPWFWTNNCIKAFLLDQLGELRWENKSRVTSRRHLIGLEGRD